MQGRFNYFISKFARLTTKLVRNSLRSKQHVSLEFNLFHRYMLQTDYQSSYGLFKAGETLVYLRSGYVTYDGYTMFSFFDITNGDCRTLCLPDRDNSAEQTQQIKKTFVDLGLDMAEGSFSPDNGSAESNYAAFAEQLDYLKALVEGKEPIKSWFVWLQENAKLLHENLSRADQLRFKYSGYDASVSILDFFAISFQESPRYKYLSMPKSNFFVNPSPPLPLP